jgi:uncharacterized protein (TIGR02466 family)
VRQLNVANSHFHAGRLTEAKALYNEILRDHPGSGQVLHFLGLIAHIEGDHTRAIELLEAAIAQAGTIAFFHGNLAEVYRKIGRKREAAATCRRALELNPVYPEALNTLGAILCGDEELDEAECHLRRAIEFRPNFAEAHANLGNVYRAKGCYEMAVEAYERALRHSPRVVEFYAALGMALRRLGKGEEALAVYRSALEIAPNRSVLWGALGIVLQEQERLDEAIAAYRKALEIEPGFAGAWANLGLTLQSLGRLEEAIDAYRRAIEANPSEPSAHAKLGAALLERGDVETAASACEAYLEDHPGDTTFLAWKAVLLNELGEAAAAAVLIDFDRFIRRIHVKAPAVFSSLAAFNAALADHVSGHPTLVYAPSRNATRFGKHSGPLLFEPKGPVAELEEKIRKAVEAYIASLPADQGHPFLANRPRRFGLRVWSILLEEQGGYQEPHIHPNAWLSGVYYVRLPENVELPEGEGNAGWIEFGRPPEHFHCTAAPEVRLFRPEPGLMLLFPSYFYHRTVPLVSPGLRISIAFDVLPKA